jgi:hypothetical protein
MANAIPPFLFRKADAQAVREHPVKFRTAQDDAAGVYGQIYVRTGFDQVPEGPASGFFDLTVVGCYSSLLKLDQSRDQVHGRRRAL